MEQADELPGVRTRKKPSYPISGPLRDYLRRYRRERELPISYERLRAFKDTIPLTASDGRPTLWDSVIYDSADIAVLNEDLKRVYALLRVDGDHAVVRHLYIDRVDFCSFGNSMPFRIRIVNAYNDNQDYFYIKKADASRIYGLELEHLLSPNRLNYLTHQNTLVEEHIAGVPGDIFSERWLENRELKPIRIAKELVKFNERCFVRLLGDMRSYNYVVVLTPDFEGWQVRIRAMDFDQQTYFGKKNFYLPQFFKENAAVVQFCQRLLNPQSAYQYQREEQALMLHRADISATRLNLVLDAMVIDPIAPEEHVRQLREGLAQHFGSDRFLRCESMGALVRENLNIVRQHIEQQTPPTPAEMML